MDCFMYRLPNSVTVGYPSQRLVKIMMANGVLGSLLNDLVVLYFDIASLESALAGSGRLPQGMGTRKEALESLDRSKAEVLALENIQADHNAYIEREVAKFLNPKEALAGISPEELIVDMSPEALVTMKSNSREPMIRRFVMGKAYGGLTEAEALSLISARGGGLNWTECVRIDPSLRPYHIASSNPHHGSCFNSACHDRYFRNAMVWDATEPGLCRCDMDKAKAVHLTRIGLLCDKQIAGAAPSYMRAFARWILEESPAARTEVARLVAATDLLEAIPVAFGAEIASITTPEELKAAWPAELPPRV